MRHLPAGMELSWHIGVMAASFDFAKSSICSVKEYQAKDNSLRHNNISAVEVFWDQEYMSSEPDISVTCTLEKVCVVVDD